MTQMGQNGRGKEGQFWFSGVQLLSFILFPCYTGNVCIAHYFVMIGVFVPARQIYQI